MGASRLKAEENRSFLCRRASLERSQGSPGGQSAGAGQSCLVPRAFSGSTAPNQTPKEPPAPAEPPGATASPGLRGCAGSPPPRRGSRCPRRTLRFLRQLHWPILLLSAPWGLRRGFLLCGGVRRELAGEGSQAQLSGLGSSRPPPPPPPQGGRSSELPGHVPGVLASRGRAERGRRGGPERGDGRAEGRPGHLPAARGVPRCARAAAGPGFIPGSWEWELRGARRLIWEPGPAPAWGRETPPSRPR